MNILTILGEPRRQRILKLVWDRELSAGDIAHDLSDISFGAVSQHLKVLVGGGLVEVRREGRSRIYCSNKSNLGLLEAYLTEFWSERLDKLKQKAEAIENQKSMEKENTIDQANRKKGKSHEKTTLSVFIDDWVASSNSE